MGLLLSRSNSHGENNSLQSAFYIACVASVSNRVTGRKLERAQKKKNKRWKGEGREEEETLARKPHDSGKRPLIFHGSVDL